MQKLDKHTNWEAIRKGCKIQELLARALYCKADVAVRKCGIEDVKLFQAVMNDVQIHVVSKEHFNSIIYQGPEAVSKIYLYFHDEQYDVFTSMPAFLNRSYYCHSCHKGYQHREEHRRNNICSSCHKIHEQSEDDWIYCLECNRYFKGTDCYQLHRIITNKGISTCNSYYSVPSIRKCIRRSKNVVKCTVRRVKIISIQIISVTCFLCAMKQIERQTQEKKQRTTKDRFISISISSVHRTI